jgi:sigma-E factor negative regulatory protein RseC
MIQEAGVVVAVSNGTILVETRRRSTCDTCDVSGGCGSSTLQRVLGSRRSRVRALCTFPVAVGDRVLVGLDETALVRGSLLLYGTPLAGLFTGALLATLMQSLGAGPVGPVSDGPVILGAALGLGASLVLLRRLNRSMASDRRYQAVILQPLRNQGQVPVVFKKA